MTILPTVTVDAATFLDPKVGAVGADPAPVSLYVASDERCLGDGQTGGIPLDVNRLRQVSEVTPIEFEAAHVDGDGNLDACEIVGAIRRRETESQDEQHVKWSEFHSHNTRAMRKERRKNN